MTLLAFDPGKTCGWALFLEDGTEAGRGVIPIDKLDELFIIDYVPSWLFWRPDGWLQGTDRTITEIVCEDYHGRPGMRAGGQHLYGPEAKGKIELIAKIANIPFTLQRPVDVLGSKAKPGPAILQSGYVQTAKHLPDQDAAYLHGFYYLVKKGVLQAKPLDD